MRHERLETPRVSEDVALTTKPKVLVRTSMLNL